MYTLVLDIKTIVQINTHYDLTPQKLEKNRYT